MKILETDFKKGVVKIYIQNREDCWHLYNIVEKGDFLSAYTYRSKKEATDKIRSKKLEKERVYIKIEVEDKEFQKFTNRLRIRGKIVEGVEEIGAYHTFNIEPNMEIKIEKKWKDYHIERLKEATKSHPKVAILAMDDEVASIAIVHEYGVEEIANILSYKSGKMYESNYDEKEYFGQILAKLKNLNLPVAIVGPGFDKDRFIDFAKNKLKNFVVDNVSHAGMVGVHEAIRRGIIERLMKENKVAKEAKLLEKLFEEISRNGLATYGKNEVLKAIEMGAVEELLIVNEMVREEEELIKKAEEQRAKIHIIESEEIAVKLSALGGIAAILRYKID